MKLDPALDLAITLLERGVTGEVEQLATWVVDNLVHILEEHRSGAATLCLVAGYNVCRLDELIAVVANDYRTPSMNSEQARMLAAALLRAAEAADEGNNVPSEMP